MEGVENRRLHISTNKDSRPCRGSDFVLLSIVGSWQREDEILLPFNPLKIDALTALWEGEEG